jgi:SAM-dependent methyltransferase
MIKDVLEIERERIGSWGELNPSRLEIIKKYAGKRILDAGCSSGAYVFYLMKIGFDAYGFDILYSKEWKGPFKGRFVIGDIHLLPYKDNEFDTVISFEVLEHARDVDKVLEEFKRVTRTNVIISVPDAELYSAFREAGLTFHHWIDRTHLNFFTEKEIREKMEEHGFVIKYFTRINPVFPERLFFENIGFSEKSARLLTKIFRKIPFKRKFLMTLALVAEKKEK